MSDNNRIHKNQKVDNETRHRINNNYLGGKSAKEIAEIFKINASTVQSIIKVYTTENRVEKR